MKWYNIFWRLKQLICFHSYDFFTEYDEVDKHNKTYYYLICQCSKCDKMKIERKRIK